MANLTVPIQVNLPDDWLEQIVNRLRNDPESEWAEIVRCKDCKHKYVDGDNVQYNVCELNHNKVQSDEWYCADAERLEE